MTPRIERIAAREILDSGGNPTIETTVYLEGYYEGTAAIPAGASIGSAEVLEMRDNDPNRYRGMGVLRAVKNVNDLLGPKFVNLDAYNQREIDRMLLTFVLGGRRCG